MVERLQKFAACDDTSHEFTVLYRCCSDAAVTPDPGEIADIKWMRVDAIQSWMMRSPDEFSPAFRLLFVWFMQNAQSSRNPLTRPAVSAAVNSWAMSNSGQSFLRCPNPHQRPGPR